METMCLICPQSYFDIKRQEWIGAWKCLLMLHCSAYSCALPKFWMAELFVALPY
jgi:hypothetical protein